MQKAFPEPIWAAGLSGHESRFPNTTLVQSDAASRFSKMASATFPPGVLLKPGLVAGFIHTTLPPLVFPGMCQRLTEGPSLQGRHTAVIKGLVEE